VWVCGVSSDNTTCTKVEAIRKPTHTNEFVFLDSKFKVQMNRYVEST